MGKRYTRKYRHWSPRWKWKPHDGAELKEFEREWRGGFPRALNRRRRRDGSR